MMLELEVIPEHGLLSEQMEIILGKPFIFKIMHSFASNLLMTQCSSILCQSLEAKVTYATKLNTHCKKIFLVLNEFLLSASIS